MSEDTILTSICSEWENLPGESAFYYKNLTTGETLELNSDLPFIAASVIKLPVMIEFFFQIQEGRVDFKERFSIRTEDKMPSCGALTYLHEGLEVTALDLCTLMIILSDNTATNLLIHRLGMDRINARMATLGLRRTVLSRLLFDSQAQSRGLENHVCASEIGFLLESLYRGELVSPVYSEQMLSILKNQRLNGKIPFFLHGIPLAHKTGEDGGISHDAGIVYTPEPFVVCFLSQNTHVPRFERWIQDTSLRLAQKNGFKNEF